MKGKFQPRESWEKQAVFKLESGHKITLEHHQVYGDFVKSIEKGGERWISCNGLRSLPASFQSFQAWVVPVGNNDKWMVPKFERVY